MEAPKRTKAKQKLRSAAFKAAGTVTAAGMLLNGTVDGSDLLSSPEKKAQDAATAHIQHSMDVSSLHQAVDLLGQGRQIHVGVGKGQRDHLDTSSLQFLPRIRRSEIGIYHVDVGQCCRQILLS